MFRQTIFGLSTALVLLTATAYSSGDERDDDARGDRMPYLGTGIPVLSSSSGRGLPSLAGAAARGVGEEEHRAAASSSSHPSSTVVVSGSERGLRTLYQQLAGSPLSSPVDLNEVLGFNNALFAKYQPYVKSGFHTPDSSTLSTEFLAFLVTNKQVLPGLIDPTNLRIFSSFLLPMSHGVISSHPNFNSSVPDRGRVLLASMAKTRHDQLEVDVKGGYILLESAVRSSNPYYPHSYPMMYSEPRIDPMQPVIDQLRKIITIDGTAVYDVPSQYDALSTELSGWFNVMRAVYRYEVGFWAKEAPLMAGLLADYKAAMTSLTAEDTQLYSGVALGATSLQLIPTAKEAKKEERTDLTAQIAAHMTANKDRIEAYKAIKDSLPTFQKVKVWLDEIFDYVKKNGRIT